MARKKKSPAVADEVQQIRQKQRLLHVLKNMQAQIEGISEDDGDEISQWSSDFEDFLNELASDDAFGTEGSTDPRGDFRNGEWSMFNVEGLDK